MSRWNPLKREHCHESFDPATASWLAQLCGEHLPPAEPTHEPDMHYLAYLLARGCYQEHQPETADSMLATVERARADGRLATLAATLKETLDRLKGKTE